MRKLTALFILICLANSVAAQVVVKEGNLFLQEGSKVSVQGDVVNYGNIINRGIVSLTGAWQNYSTYTSSAGTIALTGSEPQSFFHNSQTVGVLYIANPSTVALATDVTVENKLILKEGVVITGEEAQLIMAEEAVVEGGAPNAYIHGRMFHTGTGSKFYPIGKNGQYAPVTLLQIVGETPLTGVEFYDTPVQTLETEENGILLQDFYWSLNTLSGTYEGSPLRLEILSENTPWEESEWVIAGSDDLNEPFRVLDQPTLQMQGNRSVFSGSKSISSRFFTAGSSESLGKLYYVPNVLSSSALHPDDRTVKVYSKVIKPEGFQWTIWDSWGQIVYTTKSYEEASTIGWQGTHKGKEEAQPGMYKYLLQGTFFNGQSFSRKGTIFLYK